MADPLGVAFMRWIGINPPFLGDLPRATFTGAGTIEPNSRFVLANSASALTLTLPAGERDGQPLIVKNTGAGTVTLSANVDGTAGTTTIETNAAMRLIWSRDNSTWISI